MIDLQLPTVVVGIDPGVATGFATWHVMHRRLTEVRTCRIDEAMHAISAMHQGGLCFMVIVEDARQRRWFGNRDKNQKKYGAGVREGAGSVKRDCKIWEDYLRSLGVPFIMRAPQAGTTKYNAVQFERITGWKTMTSEHGRDAGMAIYGINQPQVKTLLSFCQPR